MTDTYSSQLTIIFLDRICIQDFPVVFADLEVFVFMVGENDLLLVVTELQICHIFVDLHRGLIRCTSLLPFLSLLLKLLNLLGGLLRLARKVAFVDLAAQDGALCPVASFYAQRNLFQNKLGLFSPGHGTECLHLQLAKDIGGSVKVTL